VIKSCK